MYIACGDQRLMSGEFFIYLARFFVFFFVCLRQGLLLNSEFTGLVARLVSQGDPGITS